MRALRYLFIFLSIAGSSIFSPILIAQESDSSSTISKDKYYVKLKGDTLFTITEKLGPFSAESRALSIGERLKILSKNDRIEIDSFTISYTDGYAIASYGNQVLLYINQEDAAARGKSLEKTAGEYLDILKSAYSEILKRRTGIYWAKRIGLTLLAILGLFLILVLLNKTFKWIDKRIVIYEKENKLLRIPLVTLLALSVCWASAQESSKNDKPGKFGIRAGWHYAAMFDDGEMLNSTDRVNTFYVGLFKEKKLASFLRLGSGLEYFQNGYVIDENLKREIHYISIPLYLKLKLGPIYATGGSGLNFRVSEKLPGDASLDPLNNEKTNFYDMPFQLGLGLKILMFSVEARYNWGLFNVNDLANNQYLQVGFTVSF